MTLAQEHRLLPPYNRNIRIETLLSILQEWLHV